MKRTFSTELAYVFGIVFVALGVVLMKKADFGASMVVAPAYLLYRWLSPVWSFVTFGMAEYCLQAVLLLAMCLLLRFRVSYLFSFVTAVVYGFALDAFMLLGAALPAGSVWLRVIYYGIRFWGWGSCCSAVLAWIITHIGLLGTSYFPYVIGMLFCKKQVVAALRQRLAAVKARNIYIHSNYFCWHDRSAWGDTAALCRIHYCDRDDHSALHLPSSCVADKSPLLFR